MLRETAVMFLVAGTIACGGGGGGGSTSTPTSPTTPTTPTPTTASVAIAAAADLIMIQGTVVMTANATMSDGSSRPNVSATWTSDATSVATVDSSGKVTGIGSGQATITVTYDNVKATRAIRVVPDYQGSWVGDYRVVKCDDTGDFRDEEWCVSSVRKGVIRMTMVVTQNRDAATGTWTHDVMSGTMQGSIETGGALVLNGTALYDKVPMTLTGWRSQSVDNRNQTGKFTLTFTSSYWKGTAVASVEIVSCVKG